MVSVQMEKQRWLGCMSHDDGRVDKATQRIRCWVEAGGKGKRRHWCAKTCEGQMFTPPVLIGCLLCTRHLTKR